MRLVLFLLIISMVAINCQQVKGQAVKHGTTIVYLIYRDTFLIAADSRSTELDENGNVVKIDTVCKIRSKGKFHFACSGAYYLTEKDSKEPIWDFYGLVQGMKLSDAPAAIQIKETSQLVTSNLQRVLESKKISESKYLRNLIDSPVVSISFFYYQNSKPKKQDHYFFLRKVGSELKFKLQIDSSIKPTQIVVMGMRDSIDKIMDKYDSLEGLVNGLYHDPNVKIQNIPNFKIKSFLTILYYLVYIETISQSTFVGEPIDIFRITKSSGVFLTPSLHCKIAVNK